MSLARAREKAAENRAAVAEDRDPLADRHAPAMPTFREAAGAVHEANRHPLAQRQAHRQLDADTGASRNADTGRDTPGADRSRGGAASPHPDMDDPWRRRPGACVNG